MIGSHFEPELASRRPPGASVTVMRMGLFFASCGSLNEVSSVGCSLVPQKPSAALRYAAA